MREYVIVALEVVNSDCFLDLSVGSQTLYFHIMARAGNNGYIDNMKSILRTVGATDIELRHLIKEGFIEKESDVHYKVTDWEIHSKDKSFMWGTYK